MRKWKIIFGVCIALMPLFAKGTSENYSNVALSYDINYEIAKIDGTTIDTSLKSIGASWSVFTFKPEKRIGVYSSLGIFRPFGGTIRSGGVGVPYSLFDAGLSFGEAYMVGPGFRKKTASGMEIFAGIGPALYFFGLGNDTVSGSVLQVGIGGDLNLNFSLGEKMYLNLGLRGQVSFYSYTFMYDSTATSTIPRNYRSYAINPRLGIGLKH